MSNTDLRETLEAIGRTPDMFRRDTPLLLKTLDGLKGITKMNTTQKLEHARCLANATRHYLNSAYDDLQGSEVPQSIVYAIIDHCDSMQSELQKLYHARGEK